MVGFGARMNPGGQIGDKLDQLRQVNDKLLVSIRDLGSAVKETNRLLRVLVENVGPTMQDSRQKIDEGLHTLDNPEDPYHGDGSPVPADERRGRFLS